MTFKNFEFHPAIHKALDECGFATASPVQEQAIPEILLGKDIRISAQTGTGKTAAFILPALQKLSAGTPNRGIGPRILILVPTRELALQVATEAYRFSKHLSRIRTICIYGGAPYPPQYRDLSRPHDILVATPGRLIDHLERRKVNLSRVEMLILDEADRMLDMGFIEPVELIASETPPDRQTILLSATLHGHVGTLSKRLMKDPIEISVTPTKVNHDNIEQRLCFADDIHHKYRLLDHVLTDPTINQAIIFTATKRLADGLVDQLKEQGHNSAALHGDMNQRQRTKTITRMRKGEIKILVATDVAARGIDVQSISHVINFDLPGSKEDYVHRIGRTGRAGNSGVAVSFAAHKEKYLVSQIELFTGQSITPHVIPGLEPTKKSHAPSNNRRPKNFSRRPGNKFRPKTFGKRQRSQQSSY